MVGTVDGRWGRGARTATSLVLCISGRIDDLCTFSVVPVLRQRRTTSFEVANYVLHSSFTVGEKRDWHLAKIKKADHRLRYQWNTDTHILYFTHIHTYIYIYMERKGGCSANGQVV